MRQQNLKDVLELAGIAAIVVGLVFVYLEIQQNGVVARASLATETSTNIDSIYQQLSDPQFAEVYTKGLHSPESLTEAERMQLNGFFNRLMPMFGRERITFNLGFSTSPDQLIRSFVPTFLGDGYGRIWWSIRKKTVTPAMVSAIDKALSSPPTEKTQTRLSDFDKEILLKLKEQ